MSHAARVFLPCYSPRFDPSGAAKFGPVMSLLDRPPHFLDVDTLAAEAIAAATALGYDPDVDFYAITGSLTPTTVIYGALLTRYGRLKVLVFDARGGAGKDGEYRSRRVQAQVPVEARP